MSVQVENLEKNMAKLTIEVSAEDLEKALESAYQKQKLSGVPREITTGVPYEGKYKEILNTDAVQYGGTGVVNDRVKRAEDVEWDDKKQSVTVKMAPLSLSILQFIPYTEAELEKVIEKRIRKNTPIHKTAGKTTKKKTGEIAIRN